MTVLLADYFEIVVEKTISWTLF